MNYEGNCDREVGGTGPGHSPSEYLGTIKRVVFVVIVL